MKDSSAVRIQLIQFVKVVTQKQKLSNSHGLTVNNRQLCRLQQENISVYVKIPTLNSYWANEEQLKEEFEQRYDNYYYYYNYDYIQQSAKYHCSNNRDRKIFMGYTADSRSRLATLRCRCRGGHSNSFVYIANSYNSF